MFEMDDDYMQEVSAAYWAEDENTHDSRLNKTLKMELNKLWCFHIIEGNDGIIIADTKEEAEQKLKAEYPERFNEAISHKNEISIWNLVTDCWRSGDVFVTLEW